MVNAYEPFEVRSNVPNAPTNAGVEETKPVSK